MPKSRRLPIRRAVYLAFSLTVTIGIFSYLFQYVSLREVLDAVSNMSAPGLAGFFLFSMLMSLMRTWRFLLMLRLSGYRPGKIALFLVVIVRNFFSDLLPARIGTLVYIYLTTNRLNVPFPAAASSFALAFVFDVIALAPLLLVAILLAGPVGALSPLVLTAAAVALVVASIAALVILPRLAAFGAFLIERLPLISDTRRRSWVEAVAQTGAEIQRLEHGGIYLKLLGLSIMVRVFKYGALYCLLYALVEPLGYTLEDLPVPRVMIGLVAPEIAASLPISGIGGFGAYEGTWAFVFSLLVFPEEIAKLTAISHHLVSQVYGAILGAVALLLLMIPKLGSRRIPKESESARAEFRDDRE